MAGAATASPVFSPAQITVEGGWGGEGLTPCIFHGKSRRLGKGPPCLPADLAAFSLSEFQEHTRPTHPPGLNFAIRPNLTDQRGVV